LGEHSALPTIFLLGGFALVILGVKIWLIHSIGDATPFWDQWAAEGMWLYKPWVEGTLQTAAMFDAHNEHRIFTTRLLALGLLEINGFWNPLLQMLVNAVIHVLTIVLCLHLINRSSGGGQLPMLVGFGLILFSIPYSTGNTLAGFQVSFYFTLLFSLAALWFTTTKLPNAPLWWAGWVLGLLAFYSLSSGALALFAAATAQALIFIFGQGRSKSHLLATGILFATGLACITYTPGVTGDEKLDMAFIAQWLLAWGKVLAWPQADGSWLGLLLQLPALIFGVIFLRSTPQRDDRRWFLLALFIWYLGQGLAVAYGRPDKPTLSRYTDFYAIGLLVNFSCLIALLPTAGRYVRTTLLALWMFVLFIGFSWWSAEMLPGEVMRKKRAGENYVQAVSEYLRTGKISALHPQSNPRGIIPYASAESLAKILDDPSVRQILPSNVRGSLIPGSSSQLRGFAQRNIRVEKGVVIPVLDSTGTRGSASFSLHYAAQPPNQSSIRFYIRGLNSDNKSSVHVTQDGRELPLALTQKQYQYWGHIAEVKVGPGEFKIEAFDRAILSGLVISLPQAVGRFDEDVTRTLAQYPAYLYSGGVLLLLYLFSTPAVARRD